MRPRKYKNKIEVLAYTDGAATADGFGGNTGGELSLGNTWCSIATLQVNKLTDFGLDQTKTGIIIEVRKRNDIDFSRSDLFFRYKGKDYAVLSTTEKNLNGYHYQIVAYT